MQVLKNDFGLFLESKYNEGQLILAHKHGLSVLIEEAKVLSRAEEVKQD